MRRNNICKLFSVKQAQIFDKYAQEKLNIPSIVLMENAGRSVAEEAVKMAKGTIAVVCGTGNNGGDGFVAARHLINAGCKVQIYIVGSKEKLKADPKINLNILLKMGQKVRWIRGEKDLFGVKKSSLIVDALFGIGLNSSVSGIYSDVIDLINKSKIPILAVDVPSGLNAVSGKPFGNAIKAEKTVTFVASKKGFTKNKGPEYCGKIIVKNIF